MSTKDRLHRPGKDVVRSFNKHVLNPVMLNLAGRKHWYASVLRHTGRRSGREYATPVVADRVPGGFIVPLPYGTDVDWLRNIRAAGSATLRSKSVTYVVTDPEIVDAATAFALVPAAHARAWRRFGIQHYLSLKTATESAKQA